MKPILSYESSQDYYPEFVTPAKKHVPEWYKKTPLYKDPKLPFHTSTFKHCIPFLDSFTTGYVVELAADIFLSKKDNQLSLDWKDDSKVFVQIRDNSVNDSLPTPIGCYNQQFIWILNGGIQIPKGYSALLTHPLNRHDLPFCTLSAVVDDSIFAKNNIPFFIKEGFEGVIPQGTPILQIIPFKRENWSSKIVPGIVNQGSLIAEKQKAVMTGWHKKNIWKRKSYE